MNESENKTAKDLLDESIESIKRKEQSSTEKLPILEDTSISDPSEKTIITGNIPTEKQVENPPKALGSIEELKDGKDDLEEINDKDIEEPISIKDKILSVCKICLKTLFFTFFGLIHLFLLLLPLLFLYSSFNWGLALAIATIAAPTIYAYILDYKKYDKYKATMYTVYTGFIYFVVSFFAVSIYNKWDSVSVFQFYTTVGSIILWILLTIFYCYKIKRIEAISLSLFSGFTLLVTLSIINTIPIVIPRGVFLLAICAFALYRIIISIVDYRRSVLPKAILYSHIMLFMLIYDIYIISSFISWDKYNNTELWIWGMVLVIPLLIISAICYYKFNKIKANIYYILLGFGFLIIGKIILSIIENWDLILSKLAEFATFAGGVACLLLIIRFIFVAYKSQFTCSSCGSEWALELVDEDIQDGYTKTKKRPDGKYGTYRTQDVKQVWRCKNCGYKVIKNKTREIEL